MRTVAGEIYQAHLFRLDKLILSTCEASAQLAHFGEIRVTAYIFQSMNLATVPNELREQSKSIRPLISMPASIITVHTLIRMYTCIQAHTYTLKYITHKHAHSCMHTHTYHTNIHTHHINIYTHKHTHTPHKYIHTHTHTTHMHIHTYHTHTHSHTHTHTHTHKLTTA